MIRPSTKPKIAILSIRNEYPNGGVLAIIKTVYQFCQTYFDPTVFVLSFDPAISTSIKRAKFSSTSRTTTFEGMQCIEVGARWAFWEPGHYANTQEQWENVLKDYDYFFAVSATPIAAHPLALLNKKFVLWCSTPYNNDRTERVKTLHGIRKIIDTAAQPFMNHIEKTILEKATTVLALSSYSKKEFNKLVPTKNISLCPQPVTAINQTSQKKDPNLIISVGRFSDPRKNIGMLIHTFAQIQQTIPQAKLCIIGQKPTEKQLKPFENTIKNLNISFSGPLSKEALANYYQKASLKLITSYQEGFGIAGLEALAAGTPVITTNCGGVNDFVINNLSGFIVRINDTNAMATKAIELLINKDLWNIISKNALQLVEQKFSLQKVHSLFQQALFATYPELALLENHKPSQPQEHRYEHSSY